MEKNECEVPFNCTKLELSEISKNSKTVMHPDFEAGATYSVDDAVNKVGYGKFQVLVTCLAGLGWLADAFEIIILSLIGDFIACDWPLQRWQNALLTSVVFAGMMLGCPVFGSIADIYGRRKSLGASVILLFVFGVATAASPSFTWMVVFRTCMGFVLGGVGQGVTLCSEYLPANVRGKAGFVLCYFWALGTVAVILLAWVIMDYFNSWRVLLVAASVPALVVIFSLKWYPESARYYLVSNQHSRAKETLERMASMNGKDLPPGNLVLVSECSKRGRITDLLNKDYRRSTFLFCYLWVSVAIAYFGIAFVSPTIIQHGTIHKVNSLSNATEANFYKDMESNVPCAKFSQRNYIDLLWTSAAEFPGLVLFTFLVEKFSRKIILSASCLASGILICLLLADTPYKVISLIFLFAVRALLVAIFQLMYVMNSEAFPTTHRAIAIGIGTAFCRLGGLLVPFVAQVLMSQNPVAALSLMGCVIMLAAVAALLLPLETRGIHLQESPG